MAKLNKHMHTTRYVSTNSALCDKCREAEPVIHYCYSVPCIQFADIGPFIHLCLSSTKLKTQIRLRITGSAKQTHALATHGIWDGVISFYSRPKLKLVLKGCFLNDVEFRPSKQRNQLERDLNSKSSLESCRHCIILVFHII